MKVLVCGGRDFNGQLQVNDTLNRLNGKDSGIDVIIEGSCPTGADYWARKWAKKNEIDNYSFRAKWQKSGKRAGPNRNEKMIFVGKPDLVIAFPGGRGTDDMVARALRNGISVKDLRTTASPLPPAT